MIQYDSPNATAASSVRNHVYIGFGLVIFLVLFLLYHSLSDAKQIRVNVDELVNVNNQKISILHKMHHILVKRTAILTKLANSEDDFDIDENVISHSNLAGKFLTLKNQIDKLLQDPNEKVIYDKLLHEVNASQKLQEQFIRTKANLDTLQLLKKIQEIQIQQEKLFNYIDQLNQYQEKKNVLFTNQVITELDKDYKYHLVTGLIIALILTIIAIKVSHFVVSYSRDMENVNSKLEEASKSVKASSQAKSEFIASMSHEIRTPLTAIRGAINLIDQEMHICSNDNMKRLTHIAVKNTTRLMTLLNDILDFSKLENNDINIIPEFFPLYDEILDIVDLYKAQANEKNVGLDFRYHSEQDIMVYLDKHRLHQILMNLLGNAVKFTHQGFIRVDVDITSSANTSFLSIQIIDSGIGISKELQQTIFERFKQADSSTTREYGGTGLGLSISRKLVEMMDGEIGVDSNPGHGSIFWLKIPTKTQTYSESA